ncbi:hypothetical protein BP6252_13381 [Coleophoma cylindrospora]|uniref:EthD domain-containing protein n=1 Tax=Coleophoma cylindrospora TaxID=1849047 RepID=A0A3D8QAN5_9HELO|nr:hypothetical protein BP6252_13381 [Coleophoma cylindrospora]
MTFTVTILYPNKEDTIFNMKHYLDVHMPLAEKMWKPAGLLEWKLVEYSTGPDEKKPTFCVSNTMLWKDSASYYAASARDKSVEIFDDLVNVCNYEPIFLGGNVVSRG